MKPDVLTQVLGFLYSAARYLGLGIVGGVHYILPSAKNLAILAEPIGFMAILTLFMLLTTAVRKVAVIVLSAGWALILVRIVLMAFQVA